MTVPLWVVLIAVAVNVALLLANVASDRQVQSEIRGNVFCGEPLGPPCEGDLDMRGIDI